MSNHRTRHPGCMAAVPWYGAHHGAKMAIERIAIGLVSSLMSDEARFLQATGWRSYSLEVAP
jgi:hypothetical protein|eukprot:6459766-Prymnesium_polylepis.1